MDIVRKTTTATNQATNQNNQALKPITQQKQTTFLFP